MKPVSLFRDIVVACGVLPCLVHGVAAAAAAAAALEASLPISVVTAEVASSYTAVYYSSNPRLLGSDGSAATGGLRVWSLDNSGNVAAPLPEISAVTPGRSKLVATVYDVDKKDLVVTIAMTDSVLRLFEAEVMQEIEGAGKTAIGDWSALCAWKNESGNQYLYLFGKKQAVQYLVRKRKGEFETVEIQTFDMPIEASSCAVSSSAGRVYFSTDDDKKVYAFKTEESTATPAIEVLKEVDDDVTGLAVYVGKSADYLLIAQETVVAVYSAQLSLLGTLKLTGAEDIEIEGLSVYQGKTKQYPGGFLAYGLENEQGKSYGISSLESAFKTLKLDINTKYDPSSKKGDKHSKKTISGDCGFNGFSSRSSRRSKPTCSCFAGFTGKFCKTATCTDNCSGHGKCVGGNECLCDAGWGGLHCSFLMVQSKLETEANGFDGDDPAIWISPNSADQSRIITTTKSEGDAGLAVFDLDGKLLQTQPAGQPNNVDMIYNFTLGDNRVVDLAYAACRTDNTLCLFEMSANGTLSTIPGGDQPTLPDFKTYGSCVFRSPKTGMQYLFVNNKDAEVIQYSLTSTANGTLATTLVRQFTAGSGGQVEGCAVDNENGFLFIGEELQGLWRYDAEPENATPEGFQVAIVPTSIAARKPGDLYADVEGVTLVPGKTAADGFLMVSCQGVSAFNVYERAPPHEFVRTFSIAVSADGQVDAVSNTDGIAAVGNRLNERFPAGLVVVHDDSNQLPEGGTSELASFKLVSLADVLAGDGLLEHVDAEWDPRA